MVEDQEAVEHVIIKLLRSSDARDKFILEAEAQYSKLAAILKLGVFAPSTYRNGVLMIPRFDRRVDREGVIRLGQESMVSALGIAEFGHLANHEDYLGVIKSFSSDPEKDIIEYIERDIANQALGNPDNHGRNTALSQFPDGSISLSTLFDFAPMRLADEGLLHSTRWGAMRKRHLDTNPVWLDVFKSIYPDDEAAVVRLQLEIPRFAERLPSIRNDAQNLGIREEVINLAMANCNAVAERVLATAV